MLKAGTILQNRYRIEKQIGQGGMGAVYVAVDQRFGSTVAIKETLFLGENFEKAFEREARLLNSLRHPALPQVRDYFSEEHNQYLVMEFIPGEDLAERLEKNGRAFELDTVLDWTRQLLEALDFLHTQEIPVIHRDIKPQNLKLTSRGKIKLLDFGIAKGNESQQNTTITNQTFVAATLHYSPLEQIYRVLDPTFREVIAYQFKDKANRLMEQTADARSDIYALGATIYHLLTNTLPIDALKRSLEIWAGKPDPLVTAHTLNPQIPPAISAVLHKAMDIEHAQRYASAKEMQSALREAFKSEEQRAEDAKRAAFQNEQKRIEAERAAILQERMRIEAEREKYLSQIEARNRQMQSGVKPTDAATVQMNQADINVQKNNAAVPKTEVFKQPPVPTPLQQPAPPSLHQSTPPATNQPSVETIPAPANLAINIDNATRLPETNTASSSPLTQNNFMPQALADRPQKKSSKLFWLVPIFGLLFLMFGGAGFGFWMWQKNREAVVSDTTVNSNTANTAANVQTLAETNTAEPTPATAAGQGDQTAETETVTPETKKPDVVKPKVEPAKKTTTTTTVVTRPTPRPVVKTSTPAPRKTEGASPIIRKGEGAGPRP